jgi:hypothetical protein
VEEHLIEDCKDGPLHTLVDSCLLSLVAVQSHPQKASDKLQANNHENLQQIYSENEVHNKLSTQSTITIETRY